MKRKSRERNRGAKVLEESNVSLALSSSESEGETIAAKRHKVVERRKSFIAIDKDREEMQNSPVRRQGHSRNQKRKSNAGEDKSSDEGAGSEGERENRGNQQKRYRRRLSKRLDEGRPSNGSMLNMSYGNLNQSIHSPANSVSPRDQPTDKKTLQEIYSTCSALFQAHKITPQNAFSLKLVECLDEIILDFDKENLPLLARTLEIGGKIYVCRVDCAHAHTIKLATEIASNEKETPSQEDEGQNDGEDGEDNPNQPGEEDRRKKKTKKKRSRFTEENEAKINTKFEDQSSKHALRRTALKSKLHRNIDEEIDFDYLSYFLKPTDPHPLYTEEQFEALGNEGAIPSSHVNEDELTDIPWLPFNIVSAWKASAYDLWGIPLPDVDPMGLPDSQPVSTGIVNDEEFAYNPEDRPDAYPEPEVHDEHHFGDDFIGGEGGEYDNNDGNNIEGSRLEMPMSLERLRSLDELQKFFLSIKGVHQSLQNKYGWAGPIFVKPHRTDLRKRPTGKDPKKAKKKMVEIKFDEVNWKDPNNRYINGGTKAVLDTKSLEKWSTVKQTIPYCPSNNFLGYDEDEQDYREPFDNTNSDDNFGNIIRFFINSNKTIFKLMEEEFKEGKNVINASILRPNFQEGLGTDDPTPEMDIEAPRDYADDSFGNQPLEPEPPLDAGTQGTAADYSFGDAIFSSMFPGSLGSDGDPMSKVSEFDSIKFSKKPKPIDMHAMKTVIKKILVEKLLLTEDGSPTCDEETKMDICTLYREMQKRVSSRMGKHMSLAIAVVGLMHVVADNKLFMVGEQCTIEYRMPWIVCRGKLWKHADNIPRELESSHE